MNFAFELARSAQAQADLGHQVERHHPFDAVLGRALSRHRRAHYPDVATEQYHIDILTAHFVRRPESFDVVVGSNLFGDILSDLGPAVTGTIGIAPSANLNPERRFPSMFEPVHGSAPDIAGKNIANPIGQIWSGAHDAGASRRQGRGGRDRRGDRAGAGVRREPDARDMGGTASTQSLDRPSLDAIDARTPCRSSRRRPAEKLEAHGRTSLRRHAFPSARHEASGAALRAGSSPTPSMASSATSIAIKAQHYWIKDYHRRDPLRQRAEGDPRPGGGRTSPDPVDETEWLQAFADKTGYPQGIVAECHLARPDAGAGARAPSGHSRMSAASAISATGDYLVDPAWRRGFAELARRTISSPASTRGSSFRRTARSCARLSRTRSSASITAPSRWSATPEYFAALERAAMDEIGQGRRTSG